MAETRFNLKNRISPRNEVYDCPEGYNFTKNNGIFALSLTVDCENYSFRFKKNQKKIALESFSRMAANPELNFDWSNAAVCSGLIHEYVPKNI